MVRTPTPQPLVDALAAQLPDSAVITGDDGSELLVDGADAAAIGRIAFGAQVELHELRPAASDLEQVFLSLTGGATS